MEQESKKLYIPEAEMDYYQNLVLMQTESKTQQMQNLIDPVRIVNKEDVRPGSVATSPPELREYLICYIYWEDDEIHKEFEGIVGRKEAWEFLKTIIIDYGIDLEESRIFTENVTIAQGVSVLKFMEYCEDFYEDTNFDINDYKN